MAGSELKNYREKTFSVKLQKATSPEKLAEKTSGQDLILTVEPSLADAVNSILNEDKAFTPFQLVDTDQDFKKEMFLEIGRETDLTWKQISYLMENILSCWKHTGQKENILEYPEFDTEQTKKILNILDDKDTPFNQLEELEVDAENVAVLKEYQFTEIDRKILPKDYNSIETFTENDVELGEFNIFSSASEIVQSIKENIEQLNPGQVGVAVKPGTKYEPLIKSALESEGIPFQRKSDAREDEDVRTFLALLETGLNQGRVRVADVRPILQQLNIRIPQRHNNRRLEDVQHGEEFTELLNMVDYLNFKEAARKYHELTDRETPVTGVMEELDLMDEQVTSNGINSIRYFLDSFEVGREERNNGVLLADPTQVSQVDRKHVFHVGMDTDWMREVKDKKWVQTEHLEEKHLKDFKSLIQSGNSYFMVQDQELNEKIIPCFYLNELLDEEFSSFAELPSREVKPEKKPEKNGFEPENYNVDIEKVDCLSQSGLNSFVQSPRLYFMDRLVTDADQEKFEKGNLFHMYAEYHANNPEKASEIPLNEVINMMMDSIEEFADELDLEDLETEFRIGVKNIRSFLNDKKLEEIKLEDYTKTEDENIFVKEFPGSNSSLKTEPYFKDKEIGAKGKIDLLLNENHLVDYKSGRRYTTQKVLKKSHVELFEEERFPDFQPLLYITEHRKHVEGKIKFTFLHFLNEIGNSVNGEDAKLKTTITYHPETFQQKKASMEVFEHIIKDVAKSNDRRKTLEKLGYQQYKTFMEEKDIPEPFNKKELLKTEFAEKFEEFAKQEVGDYKYVEKGIQKTLKKLVDYRLENYFKEDPDQMEKFLQQKLSEINEYLDSRFPVNANPEELNQRDLILK